MGESVGIVYTIFSNIFKNAIKSRHYYMALNMHSNMEEDCHGRLCFSDNSFPEISRVTQKRPTPPAAAKYPRVGLFSAYTIFQALS
jgi:hypothetical protein